MSRPFARPALLRPGTAQLAWLAWVVVFCTASAFFPRDASFDVVHYHIQNGWSALEGRLSRDLAPSELHSFLNPAWQAIAVWLILHLPGHLAAALLALPQALILPALYVLTRRLGASRDTLLPAAPALAIAVMGFSAALQFTLFASLRNDVVGALAFILALIALSPRGRDAPGLAALALSSLLIGYSAGAKLTNLVYLTGYAAAVLLAIPGLTGRARAALVCAGAGLAGLLLGGGAWAFRLWQETGNPMFPMMNGLFGSSLGTAESFRDARFLPHSLPDGLTRPFRFLFDGELIGGHDFFDPRLVVGYLAALAIAGLALAGLRHRALAPQRPLLVLAGAFLSAFVFWTFMFSIERYFLAGWLIGPSLAAGLVARYAPGALSHPRARLAGFAGATALVLLTSPPELRRVGWTSLAEPYAWSQAPDDPRFADALILMSAYYPTAFNVLAFPESARFGHIDTQEWSRPALAPWRTRFLDPVIADPQGPALFAVVFDPGGGVQPALARITADNPVLADPDACQRLRTSFDHEGQGWYVCPLTRR